MKTITNRDVTELNISPEQCVEWVRDAFILKSECQLPAKMAVHPSGNDFFMTMPCLLPASYGRFGVKVVSRIVGRQPALKSDMMLFDSTSGELLSLVDCDWITAMRTGAVAALAIKTLRSSKARDYAFIGLGSTARATLRCLLATCGCEQLNIRLFRYKDQAERIVAEFADVPNARFTIVDTASDYMIFDASNDQLLIEGINYTIIENGTTYTISPVGFDTNTSLSFYIVATGDSNYINGNKSSNFEFTILPMVDGFEFTTTAFSREITWNNVEGNNGYEINTKGY